MILTHSINQASLTSEVWQIIAISTYYLLLLVVAIRFFSRILQINLSESNFDPQNTPILPLTEDFWLFPLAGEE